MNDARYMARAFLKWQMIHIVLDLEVENEHLGMLATDDKSPII